MRLYRPVLGFALALMLAISSLGMAVARGQAAAGSDLVICSGAGFETVTLDAKGKAIGPAHPCPYCLAGHVLAILPDAMILPAPAPTSDAHSPALSNDVTALAPPAALARGPPRAA